jgi:hypothetical protein
MKEAFRLAVADMAVKLESAQLLLYRQDLTSRCHS